MVLISQSGCGLELYQVEDLKMPSRLARCIYYIRGVVQMQLNASSISFKKMP